MIQIAKIIKKRRLIRGLFSPKIVIIFIESSFLPRFHFKDVELVLVNFTILPNMPRASTEVAK